MRVRRNFVSLGEQSETPVYDAVSQTQPDMSMSIQEIVERFAFVGDKPIGLMADMREPSLADDTKLLDSIDLDGLDIAELEELSANLMERATYLRGQQPKSKVEEKQDSKEMLEESLE